MNLLGRSWTSVAGARDEAIQDLVAASPYTLPSAYLTLLRLTNGGEGPIRAEPGNLALDPAEVVVDNLASNTFRNDYPKFVPIGGNGGGEHIGLDYRTSSEPSVVAIDMTNDDLDESVVVIAPDFASFVEMIGEKSND